MPKPWFQRVSAYLRRVLFFDDHDADGGPGEPDPPSTVRDHRAALIASVLGTAVLIVFLVGSLLAGSLLLRFLA
ncbi:hypothetical protein [Actinoplanes aureus]|jgi:hypothetical protein|uniref:Uncharacterized protein n=1 Tax=Actinoplanes aureus TaxID=2792083 RepID=A0A931CD35_9ACTN|nr:hypothetical protein [Actinoplanes aureus]MBG0567879.1 hypothetical protein [Actinoplanes aureus]